MRRVFVADAGGGNTGRRNRDGTGRHAISAVPLDLDNVELRYSRGLGAGRVSFGMGYDDYAASTTDTPSRFHGFAVWQQGF